MRFLKTAINAIRNPPLGSWREARVKAGTYEDDLINRFRVERRALRSPSGDVVNGTLLPLLTRLIGKADLSVTDFGGATGELGEDFLFAYPNAHYTVVENQTLVGMMEGRSRVQFSTDLPKACDIFYTSGTLQYLDEPMEILKQGMTSARHAAVLVRNSFSETEAFHVQRSRLFENGAGPIPSDFSDRAVSHAHRSISEATVLRVAEDCGFQCIAKLEEYTGTLFGAYGNQYGRQLVFWRVT